MTAGVAKRCKERDKPFHLFISSSLTRHISGDWGDLCDEDKQVNEAAISSGERVFSKYLMDPEEENFEGPEMVSIRPVED